MSLNLYTKKQRHHDGEKEQNLTVSCPFPCCSVLSLLHSPFCFLFSSVQLSRAECRLESSWVSLVPWLVGVSSHFRNGITFEYLKSCFAAWQLLFRLQHYTHTHILTRWSICEILKSSWINLGKGGQNRVLLRVPFFSTPQRLSSLWNFHELFFSSAGIASFFLAILFNF